MTFEDASEQVKRVIDVASIGALLGTLLEALPHIASVTTIIWTCFRIYETHTVQRWLNREPKP